MTADSKSIKFPDKHYVGFQSRPSRDEVPLGFMTPDGTDKAAVKRKATVDSWSRGYGYDGQNVAQNKLPAQTYDNKPMVGFKLGRNVRHGYGWGQGNVKWRIEDPRGFELEITSPNLAQILGFCTIQEGEILEQCIWARMGNENILVPVNSDVYTNAIKNTERMAKSASLKDLKIGDSAVFHNGDQGIYYGVYFVTSRAHDYNGGRQDHYVKCGDKKRHVFLMQGADGLTSSNFFKAMSSPKLSQVFEGTAMTHEDAEREIMKLHLENDYRLDEATNDYGKSPIAFTIEKMDPANFTLEKMGGTLTEVEEFIKEESAKRPHFHRYMLREYNEGAISLFDMEGKTWIVDLGQIFEKRTYLPGGANYSQVTQRAAMIAANPAAYSHYSNHSFTKLHRVEVANDPAAENGQIVAKSDPRYGRNYGYHYNHNVEVEVADIPEDFHWYRLVGKSNAGTEIICHC